MFDLSAKSAASLASVLVIAMTVGACSSSQQETRYMGQEPDDDPITEGIESVLYPGKWEQLPREPQNLVETIVFEHEVGFAPGSVTLSPEERRRLLEFLSQAQVRPNETVRVAAPRPTAGKGSDLRGSRVASIREELSRLGYSVSVRESAAPPPGQTDQITLTFSRSMVIPPDCTVPQPRPGDRPQLIKGCANTTALGLMVADPEDLLRGRNLAPGDAEFLGAGVERYRTDQVKPLVDTESTTE